MPDTCIKDRFDDCAHDCPGCSQEYIHGMPKREWYEQNMDYEEDTCYDCGY